MTKEDTRPNTVDHSKPGKIGRFLARIIRNYLLNFSSRWLLYLALIISLFFSFNLYKIINVLQAKITILEQLELKHGQIIRTLQEISHMSYRKDFASFTAGASIIQSMTSPTFEYRQRSKHFGTAPSSGTIIGSPPSTALLSDLSLGACWAFPGSKGQIAIFLSRRINITAITLGHVTKAFAYNLDTAPRDFELWGLTQCKGEKNLLMRGSYNINFSIPFQYFDLPQSKSLEYQKILFKIESNHGNSLYTCLYRIKVHGNIVDENSKIYVPT
ncbi:hypothetical protein O181_049739 [Austropuccinia psidii MF-1]|uniref:SUN domain-containing protein n=1 Tax=Austropuccinia psidii MF-1 TaxID=1389203 RepID=A0A9Q3HP17_9BASI|nr:hypothetical protein [Austropuccinia psidii MF-1]